MQTKVIPNISSTKGGVAFCFEQSNLPLKKKRLVWPVFNIESPCSSKKQRISSHRRMTCFHVISYNWLIHLSIFPGGCITIQCDPNNSEILSGQRRISHHRHGDPGSGQQWFDLCCFMAPGYPTVPYRNQVVSVVFFQLRQNIQVCHRSKVAAQSLWICFREMWNQS